MNKFTCARKRNEDTGIFKYESKMFVIVVLGVLIVKAIFIIVSKTH